MDKVIESEFIKTIDIFDMYVDSLGKIDPEMLKTKAYKEAVLGMKPLDPSVHDAQIERNLPKIREKLEKQIDGLNKDIEHTNHARV